jgi:hypothetical protein
MTEYDNTNRGAIFKNKGRDPDNKNHPHGKGTLNVEGVEYWVSAWTKDSQAGEKYQSISVQRKEQKFTKPESGPQRARPSIKDEMEDEIPW